jgi:hypothetical protein
MQVLVVAYQNANRQMAVLSEFIREAEMLNASIERFRSVFNALSNLYTGYDLAAPQMVLPFEPKQVTAMENLRMTSPIGTFATQNLPQLYVRVVEPDFWWNGYKWEFFFIDVDSEGKFFENVVHEDHVCYGRFEKACDPPAYDLETYASAVKAMEGAAGGKAWQEAGETSYAFKTRHQERWLRGGFTPAVYYRCAFNASGEIAYEHVFGGVGGGAIEKVYELFANGVSESQKCVAPNFFGAVRKTLEEIRKRGADCYIMGAEIQAILDTLRANIDYIGNSLQGVVTQVAVANNDMEQSFAVATSIIEAAGEGQRRTMSSVR